jgi:hypothetical protein
MPIRYMVFHGWDYYPLGGADDLLSVHATEEEALQAAKDLDCEYKWWHIYDSWAGEVIHRKRSSL